MVSVLQKFDPPGVCARSLSECLAIQLRVIEREPAFAQETSEAQRQVHKTALAICKQPMELLARREIHRT